MSIFRTPAWLDRLPAAFIDDLNARFEVDRVAGRAFIVDPLRSPFDFQAVQREPESGAAYEQRVFDAWFSPVVATAPLPAWTRDYLASDATPTEAELCRLLRRISREFHKARVARPSSPATSPAHL